MTEKRADGPSLEILWALQDAIHGERPRVDARGVQQGQAIVRIGAELLSAEVGLDIIYLVRMRVGTWG